MAAAAHDSAARVAASRPALWRELAIGLAVFACYILVSVVDWPGRAAFALRNSRQIFEFERDLHLAVEPALNQWLVPRTALRVLANYEYAIVYVLTAFGTLAWLYVRRPGAYRRLRTSFVLINLIGVACFAAYPVTPPRMIADLGFVDTVRLGRTWGSWGSPLVSGANQLAAMPSLHIAWALWVCLALAVVAAAHWAQVASAVHVLITLLVIMATANHYLLDAAGAVALVILCGVLTRERRPVVPAADAFFLYVETAAAPQHVGGVAWLDCADQDGLRDRVAAVIAAHLDELPRFRQRLSAPSRWRRPRWVSHLDLDWSWHVPHRDLAGADGGSGGEAALRALVAEVAATPLPRDRPMWRFFVVTGVATDRAAIILMVHHVVADGIGTVAQALALFEPVGAPGPIAIDVPAVHDGPLRPDAAAPARPAPVRPPRPGPLRTVAAVTAGIAQLATDGASRDPLPGGTPHRRFGTLTLPLDEVRAVARRHRARVSDVLLTMVAGAVSRVRPDLATPGRRLRVAVPLMVREPGSAPEGNLTAAVMTELPLVAPAEVERLAAIAAGSRRLYTGTRAVASRFVMDRVGEALPVPLHAVFARTVYGRRFFSGVVSNMPGPDRPLALAGAPLSRAYPILPLAPGTPLAVGALGWNDLLCVGVVVDPVLTADADTLAGAAGDVFAELNAAGASGQAGGAAATVPDGG